MQELPLLTDVARKVLHCCVYDLDDMRRYDCELHPHMIYSYFDKQHKKQISEIEIDDCIQYFEESLLIRDVTRDLQGKIDSFRLTHKGFYYFELEKSINKRCRRETICNSFLLPVIVSIITTMITLLLSD